MDTVTGSGRIALVVFGGACDLWWQRPLKPGFRHCFVVLPGGRRRVLVDPLSYRTEIHQLALPPAFDLAGFYRDHGYTVIETPMRRPRRPAPWFVFTCVEAVKRVLGVRGWFVWTPHQLYRHLAKEE